MALCHLWSIERVSSLNKQFRRCLLLLVLYCFKYTYYNKRMVLCYRTNLKDIILRCLYAYTYIRVVCLCCKHKQYVIMPCLLLAVKQINRVRAVLYILWWYLLPRSKNHNTYFRSSENTCSQSVINRLQTTLMYSLSATRRRLRALCIVVVEKHHHAFWFMFVLGISSLHPHTFYLSRILHRPIYINIALKARLTICVEPNDPIMFYRITHSTI